MPSTDSATGLQPPATTPTDIQLWLDRIVALKVKPATTVAETCAAVRRTALHQKLPDRKGLKFERGEKSGGIIDLDVAKDALPRALPLADLFVRTAEGLGWSLQDPLLKEPEREPPRNRWDPPAPSPEPAPLIARLLVEGEPIAFRIKERMREEPRTPSEPELVKEKRHHFYYAPRTQMVATGALRIVRTEPQAQLVKLKLTIWRKNSGARTGPDF